MTVGHWEIHSVGQRTLIDQLPTKSLAEVMKKEKWKWTVQIYSFPANLLQADLEIATYSQQSLWRGWGDQSCFHEYAYSTQKNDGWR
jgi:hypothetical protein